MNGIGKAGHDIEQTGISKCLLKESAISGWSNRLKPDEGGDAGRSLSGTVDTGT